MPKDTPQVDHKAEALRLLEAAVERGQEIGSEPSPDQLLAGALVYSNLAIAEGQLRVADEIKAFRERMAGSAT